MATVHLGRLRGPVGFSRTVAIKKLHPQYAKDPEFVNMFLDEARLVGRIRHPNVVPTLDVVSNQGEILLVMEYVQGESLSRLIRTVQARGERISPRVAATVLSGVLHGLHAAHEARNEQGEPLGIVHRDVSPQNVMVGVDGVGHVLDFGVAKAAGRMSTTREGQIKGKLSYMAPEQLNGGAVTRQSDVYAAAVVLWETLTLRRLYDGDNEAAVLVKVIEGRVERPSRLVTGIPPELDAVVLRGLERDTTKRFATAREMALALERCIGIAAPSEVGEWVESIAQEELAKRARRVAEIERRCATNGSEPDLTSGVADVPRVEEPPGESVSGIRVGELPSQVSTISVSKSEHSVTPPPVARRKTPPWLFLAGGVALGVLATGLLVSSRATSPPIAATGSSGGTTASAAPAPTSPAPSSTTATIAVSASTAEAAPPSTGTHGMPPPPPSSAPAPVPVKATAPKPPPRAVAAKPPAECDPPFTRDAQGHKHYKLQCL
jgi:serine/threonine-protein kinase